MSIFFRYFRLHPEHFDHLLQLVRGSIEKDGQKRKDTISADERLAKRSSIKVKASFHFLHAAIYNILLTTSKFNSLYAHFKIFSIQIKQPNS